MTSLICPIRARLFPGVLTDLVLSFRQLAQLIEGNNSFSDLLDIGKDLQNILDPKVDKIYAGDIYTTISIMKVLNREANRTMYTNISNEDLTRFLEVRALNSWRKFTAGYVRHQDKWYIFSSILRRRFLTAGLARVALSFSFEECLDIQQVNWNNSGAFLHHLKTTRFIEEHRVAFPITTARKDKRRTSITQRDSSKEWSQLTCWLGSNNYGLFPFVCPFAEHGWSGEQLASP